MRHVFSQKAFMQPTFAQQSCCFLSLYFCSCDKTVSHNLCWTMTLHSKVFTQQCFAHIDVWWCVMVCVLKKDWISYTYPVSLYLRRENRNTSGAHDPPALVSPSECTEYIWVYVLQRSACAARISTFLGLPVRMCTEARMLVCLHLLSGSQRVSRCLSV